MMILKSNIPVKIYWLSWHYITSIVQNLLQTSRSIYERRIIEDILLYCQRKGFAIYEFYKPSILIKWRFIDKFKLSCSHSRYSFYHSWQYQPVSHFFNNSFRNTFKLHGWEFWRFIDER